MITNNEYSRWLDELKRNIRQCQIKAALTINRDLLYLYWALGKEIVEKQELARWGDGFITRLSKDLSAEFPEMKGWSERNLRRIRKWYLTYFKHFAIRTQLVSNFPQTFEKTESVVTTQSLSTELSSQQMSQEQAYFFSIPWGHHVVVMQKCKDWDEANFYIVKTVENNWSRSVLEWQIESKLFERQGKAITNFVCTLPSPQSDLAKQITKDPYVVDLMGVRQEMTEREIEAFLNSHISQYLLELGKGFTYYGHQVKVRVGNDDFFIDQLFYHVQLHCYVVVELKATKFNPEQIGQLNFYVSAVDAQLKSELDNPTIGLLICKDKNDIVAEYSLRNVVSPIGVSSLKIYNNLMEQYKSTLPSIEEIEDSFKSLEDCEKQEYSDS